MWKPNTRLFGEEAEVIVKDDAVFIRVNAPLPSASRIQKEIIRALDCIVAPKHSPFSFLSTLIGESWIDFNVFLEGEKQERFLYLLGIKRSWG